MYDIKAFACVEVYVHLFLSLALNGSYGLLHSPDNFTSTLSAPFHPLNKRPSGPQSVWMLWKTVYVSPPIHNWNDSAVRPVDSRCAQYDVAAHMPQPFQQ
jgi:hypothetical protein